MTNLVRVSSAVNCLVSGYELIDLGNLEDPIEELIYISLTRQTHEKNTVRSWEALKSLGGPLAIMEAPVERLVALIKDAGFSRQKAQWIKGSLELIHKRFGELSLRQAQEWPDDELEAFLCSLPGISIKTAKCIMMFSMGRQVLPVDTHVRRISERAGLVAKGLSEKRVHNELERVVMPHQRYAFHVSCICHGRAVCKVLNPSCAECVLKSDCAFLKASAATDVKEA